jgi:hypothetical protein
MANKLIWPQDFKEVDGHQGLFKTEKNNEVIVAKYFEDGIDYYELLINYEVMGDGDDAQFLLDGCVNNIE